ncbi:hypothetical protein MMC09_001996 [Bachmanniomyces sp. S44760]|nr:hypothetical protein [Bachmanniomyces sp. S44760]
MPSPIQTATIQAAVLNLISSFLAQVLTSYRSSSSASGTSTFQSVELNYTKIIQFLIYTLISTPPNFLWQQYLERQFPAYPLHKGKQKLKVDDDGKGVVVEERLDTRNTAIKFFLDQTLAATVNITMLLGGITAMKGGNLTECVAAVRDDFWPILKAGYKLWPLVSILNFTIVPVERRLVVGSMVGLGWNVYLALTIAG